MRKNAGIRYQVSVLFTVLLFTLIFCFSAFAVEQGGTRYPDGAEDMMVGAAPPPGFYFMNYAFYYNAGKFKMKDGDMPDFKAKVFANVFRFIYFTDVKILGADWGMHMFVPIINANIHTPGGSGVRTGLGDIIIDPFILAWHFKDVHMIAGVDIYTTTGAYSKDRIANLGSNYWTFQPVYAITYLNEAGIDISAKFMYDINTKNNDTGYLSGQALHFDWAAGYKMSGWEVGLGGYVYTQLTNDTINGQKVGEDGFKSRIFSLGPVIKYDYRNMSFTAKYYHEMSAQYRPQGDKFWLKFMYAF